MIVNNAILMWLLMVSAKVFTCSRGKSSNTHNTVSGLLVNSLATTPCQYTSVPMTTRTGLINKKSCMPPLQVFTVATLCKYICSQYTKHLRPPFSSYIEPQLVLNLWWGISSSVWRRLYTLNEYQRDSIVLYTHSCIPVYLFLAETLRPS